MKKIKYNFDVETINLKIDKALLKIKYAFTLYAQFTTNKYYTHNNTLLVKKTQNILTYHLLLYNTLKTLNNVLNK